MDKKSIVFLLLLILAPVIIYFLWPTDESRIKKLVKEGAAAVEKKETDKVMAKVSFNYRDDYGFTYMMMKKMFEDQFKRMSDIKIDYEDLKLQIKEDSALVDLNVRVIATIGDSTGYIIGDIKTPAHIKLTLEKERANWLVTKTEGLPNF